MRAVCPRIDDEGQDISVVVHVHSEVQAGHIAEPSILAELRIIHENVASGVRFTRRAL